MNENNNILTDTRQWSATGGASMEKKHHFQGFRKFSIKTRLVIALLMISIIPLAGISGYSFHIFSHITIYFINFNIVRYKKRGVQKTPLFKDRVGF